MQTILIHPHNPFVELETLQAELQHAILRLGTSGPEARLEIKRQIREIQRDIQRNSKKISDLLKDS